QGDAYSSSSGSKQAAITLQFADVGQWTQLLNDLGGNAAIKGVLFSSLFETDLNALHHGQQILDSQHQLFAGKLNCIKALQLQASTQNPRLWFISKGMMNVGVGNETMGPLSSGVSGFAKVMQMEHPELNSVFIDIESITNDAMLQHTSQSIINEMAEAGTEKMVALRLGKRHVPRLSRLGNAASKMEIPAAPYRLIIEKKGVFDDLKYVQFEPVPLTATEVAVKVLRSGLNFRDVMGVLDVYPGEAGPLGGECIGEIIQLGSDVKDLSIGDRILIPLGMACMSSQMNTESQLVTRIPRNLTLNEAATIPVAYTTAMHGLVNLGKLKKGDRILIHAGAGGVGLAAIYIAKKLGAEIFATASEKKRPFLRSIGVDHVLDSRSLSFADDIKRITNNDGVVVVLNSLAGEFIRASMGLLNKGGRFIEIGKADIWSPERVTAFRDDITYDSFDLVTLTFTDPHLVKKLMDGIVNDLEQGVLKPLPYKEFRQSEAIDAFRYMAQGKHIGKILINPEPEPLTIRTDSSYLITGAGGGLGLLFADWLISKGAKELVLVGRKDIRETQADAVIALEEKGAIVRCLRANMGDEKEVGALFQTIEETCLPLAGVIHAAGVLNDGYIINQDMDSFNKVMSPKLAGAWLLHQHTKDKQLDLFVMFSSLSSLLGAPGQSNYAAANAFLDGLAHYRRSLDLPAIAVNWGPWAEVGMAANTTVESSANSGGVHYLKPAEGLEQFERILASNPIQRGVFPIDWQALAANIQGEQPVFLSNLNIKASSGVDADLKKMADEFRSDLAEVPIDERTSLLMEKICEQLKRVMGLEEDEDIDPTQPLQELGLDSLMAVELRNILCALVGKQLPATLMFKYPTVSQLSEFLIADMFPDSDDDLTEDIAENMANDVENEESIASGDLSAEPEEDLDESLGELSQDELEKMLSEELDNL
ncbi:MAG: SDR family NAD(P)-dependent oxidoreductase, partial [Pseudomonadales bacterium]|nr:SDR family NAD(P)-dependent oxidoreductase [Pseudomonadales bacterium]